MDYEIITVILCCMLFLWSGYYFGIQTGRRSVKQRGNRLFDLPLTHKDEEAVVPDESEER